VRRGLLGLLGLLGLIVLAGAATAVVFRPDKAARVATGLVSHTLCSETFVAGLDPATTLGEIFQTMPGLRHVFPYLKYQVDRNAATVTVSLAGRAESRAVARDGIGCRLVYPSKANVPIAMASLAGDAPPGGVPEIAGPAVVEPSDDKLLGALERAFAEVPGGPHRGTKAVIVLHDGRIVAERYAPGYGIDTPMLGWSMTKSVTNALVGILVRQGKLAVAAPAPVAAWRNPSDPRHAITIEQLMRMTSGLALDETNTGFDPSSRTLFTEPDMAAFAESARLQAPPGTRFHYSSASTILLSRIVTDAVGGKSENVRDLAERELFGPLGMRDVTLEFDAVGTPVGSTYMYATARDWARFGLLYANDGVVGRRRILPGAGWTSRPHRPRARARATRLASLPTAARPSIRAAACAGACRAIRSSPRARRASAS